ASRVSALDGLDNLSVRPCPGLQGQLQSGFTDGVLASLPKGKELTMMLLDGVHFANVLAGHYRFSQLLDYAIKSIALKGEIYCSHKIS
ncbi:hypothetical protein, partial [Burkholderia cepacia]|uniref:hypothetical protein n=1 Tax=Burkholderia cepacia TaxID=292 RepID=UPI001E517A87